MHWARITTIVSVVSMVNARIIWKLSENGSTSLVCNNEQSNYKFVRGDFPDNNLIDTLSLKQCGVSELGIGCFEGFPALTVLNISYNRIKTLRFGIFDGLSKLWILDLSHNLIRDLPADVFDNVPILGNLYLAGNHLTNLNPEALRRAHLLVLSRNSFRGNDLNGRTFSSKVLWDLYLDNNNMEGAPDEMFENTPSLTWLYMRNCSLSRIPTHIRSLNLIDLKLNGNKIREITNLDHLIDLRYLGLGNNLIEEIDEGAFATMKRLTLLDLSGNRIRAVTVDHFRGLSKLLRLDLSSNRVTFLESNFLKDMKNSGVSLRYFGFDKNPWQCACLRDVLQEAFSLDIIYDSERHDGNHILCIAGVKFVCNRFYT